MLLRFDQTSGKPIWINPGLVLQVKEHGRAGPTTQIIFGVQMTETVVVKGAVADVAAAINKAKP